MAFLSGALLPVKKRWIIPRTALILIGVGYKMRNFLPYSLTKDPIHHRSTRLRLENIPFAAHIFFHKPLFGIGMHAPLRGYLSDYLKGSQHESENWGLTRDSRSGKYGIYLRQSNKRDVWFYNGKGAIGRSPNSFVTDSNSITTDKGRLTVYRISAYVKGKGVVDLCIWSSGRKGEVKSRCIGHYYLPEHYVLLKKIFRLPKNTQEFRLAFLLRGDGDEPSSIYLDDIVIEQKKGERPEGSDISQERGTFRTLFSSGLEKTDPCKGAACGWHTYSDGRPIEWPWGLTRDSHSGTYAVYLEQPDERDYWLYTGLGDIVNPPTSYFDDTLRITESNPSLYTVSAYMQGKGFADLYVWWYDEEGKSQGKELRRYYLSEEYIPLKKTFRLPKEARELRVAFLLRGGRGELSAIYVDDLTVGVKGRGFANQRSLIWRLIKSYDFEQYEIDNNANVGWFTYSERRENRLFSKFTQEKKTFENIVLCGLVEMGGLFSITYIALIIYLLRNLFRYTRDDSKNRLRAKLLLIPLAGFFIHSMSFDSLAYPHLNWLFHSYLGLMANFDKI